MGVLRKIKHNCKHAQETGLQCQAGQKIGFINWLKLKYHLVYCKYCKRFLSQSKIIDKALQSHKEEIFTKSASKLPDAAKKAMQQKINTQ